MISADRVPQEKTASNVNFIQVGVAANRKLNSIRIRLFIAGTRNSVNNKTNWSIRLVSYGQMPGIKVVVEVNNR